MSCCPQVWSAHHCTADQGRAYTRRPRKARHALLPGSAGRPLPPGGPGAAARLLVAARGQAHSALSSHHVMLSSCNRCVVPAVYACQQAAQAPAAPRRPRARRARLLVAARGQAHVAAAIQRGAAQRQHLGRGRVALARQHARLRHRLRVPRLPRRCLVTALLPNLGLPNEAHAPPYEAHAPPYEARASPPRPQRAAPATPAASSGLRSQLGAPSYGAHLRHRLRVCDATPSQGYPAGA